MNEVPVSGRPGTLARDGARARRWAVRSAAVTSLAAGIVLASAVGVVSPWPVATVTSPDSGSTGVPDGVTLIPYEGDLVVTEAGAVVDGLDVHGTIVVRADDVTIRNTRVRGRPATHTTALVRMTDGHANLTVESSELVPDDRSPYLYGVIGWSVTVDRVEIARVVDGVHIIGPDVTIRNSLIHDLNHYENDPNRHGGETHDDGVQIQVGTNVRILDNTITGGWNAAVQVTQDRGAVGDLHIRGNHLDGGMCTVNIAEKAYGPVAGVILTDNRFGRTTRLDDCAVISPTTTVLTARDNRFTDGRRIAIRPGASG